MEAFPYDNYEFYKWTLNGDSISNETVHVVTISGNTVNEFKAYFKKLKTETPPVPPIPPLPPESNLDVNNKISVGYADENLYLTNLDNYIITVNSLDGTLITKFKNNEAEKHINLSSGIYILHAVSSENRFTTKFIVR
ncbi:hypothetical protein Barb6XT_02516 [Bacteroidales bacterium Barb6XT]|nr:hypothetical protein Barb6XT_02516 [Bacteroidales bacterium Barb6XT]